VTTRRHRSLRRSSLAGHQRVNGAGRVDGDGAGPLAGRGPPGPVAGCLDPGRGRLGEGGSGKDSAASLAAVLAYGAAASRAAGLGGRRRAGG